MWVLQVWHQMEVHLPETPLYFSMLLRWVCKANSNIRVLDADTVFENIFITVVNHITVRDFNSSITILEFQA